MRNVEISVHCIAKSTANDAEIAKWLQHIGAVSYDWPRQPEENVTSAEAIIGLAAKRCYMSFTAEDGLNPNVTKVRKDWTEYFNNILASGHGSVCEHATYTFAFEGVSRVFTGEMNRHRAGVAISEGSMRYIRFTDIPWWMPTSIRIQEGETGTIAAKKLATQLSFARVFKFVEEEYTKLVEMWELDTDKTLNFHFKKQLTSCLRRIVPMGVATGGVWTLNVRSLRHLMALRTSAAAEEEIALVLGQVAKYMCEAEPRLFGDFTQTPEGYWVPKHAKI